MFFTIDTLEKIIHQITHDHPDQTPVFDNLLMQLDHQLHGQSQQFTKADLQLAIQAVMQTNPHLTTKVPLMTLQTAFNQHTAPHQKHA